MEHVAIIFGITGQDGSYLSELLLEKDYHIIGMLRRSSSFNTSRIDNFRHKIELMYGDITDIGSIINILKRADELRFHTSQIEIYNLAAQSHVKVSFDVEKYTADVDAMGVLNLFQAIKILHLENHVKVYQASTSELYGNSINQNSLSMLDEQSKMEPVSPYAIAKLYSFHLLKYYRNAYNIFAVNGILFNHTSPRRGDNFVCKKITDFVKSLSKKAELTRFHNLSPLRLGNLNSTRDFGHARDYVRGMWMMLQSQTPDDYVLATGQNVSIRKFVELALSNLGIEIQWIGDGLEERGVLKSDNSVTIVQVDEKYYRPYELNDLLGDFTKAREKLGWIPMIGLDKLIKEMIFS